ncbi:hypothetical protein PR003_g17004 [Phytophthora rubi]|uniref:Malic enzyme NAD-binding domain-containing protein n=1 Tax=Phytophthora rubi TaxID=129364 RepID=A0A6A4EU76_9STRA|nr:hypothetical protein PR003_g17004 [Phytophthora rubi]
MALELPVLLLGVGVYSGVDACKTFAAIVATVIGQRYNLPDEIPENAFYEEYLPNHLQFATSPVMQRPNLNSAITLLEIGDRAITTLEQAAAIRSTKPQRFSNKRIRDANGSC